MLVGVPGCTGDAAHWYAVAAQPVVVGGDVAAAVAAGGAGHLAVAAAGLGVADCSAEAAPSSAQGQEWELTAHAKIPKGSFYAKTWIQTC